jgi:hypothetical protein
VGSASLAPSRGFSEVSPVCFSAFFAPGLIQVRVFPVFLQRYFTDLTTLVAPFLLHGEPADIWEALAGDKDPKTRIIGNNLRRLILFILEKT